MFIDDYKAAVIDLFRSGRATEEQWAEMAECVQIASETSWEATQAIDETIRDAGGKRDCNLLVPMDSVRGVSDEREGANQ